MAPEAVRIQREPVTTAAERPPEWGGPAPTPEQVFRLYAPKIYNLARRLLGNDADAEDATQEVFVQLLRKLPSFRGEAAFPTWLYRVAVNTVLTYRRKRAVREAHRLPDPLKAFRPDGRHHPPVVPWGTGPEKRALDEEVHRLIEAAIARLPALYRDVYVLADVEGLTAAAIAGLLGLSAAAVKSRLHRARLLMRQALAPYFEEKVA